MGTHTDLTERLHSIFNVSKQTKQFLAEHMFMISKDQNPPVL